MTRGTTMASSSFFFLTFLSKESSQAKRWFLIELGATQDIPKQLKARPKECLQPDSGAINDPQIHRPFYT